MEQIFQVDLTCRPPKMKQNKTKNSHLFLKERKSTALQIVQEMWPASPSALVLCTHTGHGVKTGLSIATHLWNPIWRLHTTLSPTQSFTRPFQFWFTWMTTSFSCGSCSQGFTFLWLQDSEENDYSSKTLVQPLKCLWIKYENIPHGHSHPSYHCFTAR